jgi:hypothetical protein
MRSKGTDMQTSSSSASNSGEPTSGLQSIGIESFWSRLAKSVFSFPVMCVSLLTALVFRFCLNNLAEPDIWWHLRNARYFFDYHSLPRFDTYSFGAAGSPWLNHQWLAELPYYLALRALGLRGILLVYFAVLTVTYAAVYYRSCRAGANCKTAAVVTAVAVLFGSVSIGPRTLLFGWLCMMALLLALDHFQRSGKGLWLLPPLFAVWINLHGSWVFGIVVLVVTIVSGLVEGEWGLVVAHRWSGLELTKLLLALVASVAALFVNPFGYRLVVYPFGFVFGQTDLTKYLTEWQSVNLSEVMGKVALLAVFALLATACFSRRRWRLDEVLLLSFALWFGFSHWRFLFFFGLILPPILGPRLNLFPPFEPENDKPWLNAAIIVSVVASLVFFFPSQARLQQQVDDEFPKAALDFMQREHISGRIFNQYGWGGYMEWAAPDLKPFIDGRADIFGVNGTFDEYHDAAILKGTFETLDKHKVDYVLFNPHTPLAYLLDHSPAWRVIYSDKKAVIYQRVYGNAMESPANIPAN